MPPIIVDLSQDSDDDECYVYPPRRALPSSPKKLQLKPTIRTPVTVRKVRPSSSSSIISFASPSKRRVQTEITAFLTSPRIKQEKLPFKPAPKRPLPMAPLIYFERHEVDVDDVEAPIPDAFDLIETPVADTDMLDHLMELDPVPGSSAASPVVLTSSPPVSHINASYRATNSVGSPSDRRKTLKRTLSSASDKMPAQSLSRPIKAMRKKAEVTATASGGMVTIKYTPKNNITKNSISRNVMAGKTNDGVSKRFRAVDRSVQTKCKGVSSEASTSLSKIARNVGETVLQVDQPPAQSHSNDHSFSVHSNSQLLDISFRSHSGSTSTDLNKPEMAISQRKQEKPAKLMCRAHLDPDCDEIECVSDFFDTYSPFHEALPSDNQVFSRERQPIRTQPLLTVVPPPVPKFDVRYQKTQLVNCLLSSNTLNRSLIRPYMTFEMLNYLREIRAQPGEWERIFKGFDGCPVHVGFTQKECDILGHTVFKYLTEHPTGNNDFPEPCESGDACEDLHNYLKTAFAGINPTEVRRIYNKDVKFQMDALPGRTKKDCVNFLVDATNKLPDSRNPVIMVDLSKCGKPKPRSKGMVRLLRDLGLDSRFGPARMEASRVRANDAMKTFQPTWHFSEGSSDILDIQWSSDGARFGMASACYSDGYNRPGNLMLGTSNPWGVKMLYRHAFKVRQQPLMNLDKFLYATVSCIRFSNDNSFFYSGSYDGFVKTWNGKTGKWISDIPLGEQVLTMATSPHKDRLIAAATKSGSINLIRLDEAGKQAGDLYKLHISKEDEEKQGLYASCLVFGNQLHPNWLIAGYDTDNDAQQHGGLAIFDVETKQVAFGLHKNKKRMYNARHFDIAMHEEGRTFVTASFQRPHKIHSPGIHSAIRVYDVRHMSSPVLLKSPQRDINKVTISPCQDYVTSSSTAGSTLVWDLRNPDQVMTELKHGVSKLPIGENTVLELDCTGVTFAQWGPHHDRFYTGSSDGVVKEWDITAGNPFIQDIAKVDTQIMSAAFSPSWDELIVGECSGAATLFSTRGDKGVAPVKLPVDWTENPDMMSPDDDNMPMRDWVGSVNVGVSDSTPVVAEEEDSGVRIARQLVAEGKMWIDGRWAWATDDVEMEG